MSENNATTTGAPSSLQITQTEHGLSRANITCAACTAELFHQGAHLTRWQPAGQEPVLFVSERAIYQPGKSIRAGIPVIFPWFGPRTANPSSTRTDGPKHGFARTSVFRLASTSISTEGIKLTLMLDPDDHSRSLGFDNFQVEYKLEIGAQLVMHLTVRNLGDKAFHFEEALHTYFNVGDASKLSLTGLAGTEYLDKTDNFIRKRQEENALTLTKETDRPYLNTTATVVINDPVLKRRIFIEKENSKTTVVWNPWSELCATLEDMAPDSWTKMVCVETANAAENIIKLGAGEEHTMTAKISVEKY